jgi:predicted HAD superfamily hydrolase
VNCPDFSKYKVISFDVFDTLITRLLSRPKDVFQLVELRAKLLGIDCTGYAEVRIAAERTARAKGAPEVTLDEIYVELAAVFRFDHEQIDQLKGLELQVERDVCVAKPAGKKLYNTALASGVPTVITSDMYLPRDFIEELLNHCGYDGWTDCFVSCEYSATKASGALYGIVANSMGVKPSDIIHVGDNLRSDILHAHREGLSTWKVSENYQEVENASESVVLGSQAVCGSPVGEDGGLDLERFGYRSLGPILVGFCEWLAVQLRQEGIEKVFYLARDGLIVQKTMDQLGISTLHGKYLYASRRALQVPFFALLDSFDDIVTSMFLPRMVSLRTVFGKTGLEKGVVADKMKEVGVDPDVERPSKSIASDQEALRAFEVLRPLIKKNSYAELSILVDYLKQNDFAGRVAIVDIGWFGNMQVALERICQNAHIDTEIHGYYVGLSPEGGHQLKHLMKGYLFDVSHDRGLFEKECCYNLIFETLFSAVHGTTRGYHWVNGYIEPILADYVGVEEKFGQEAEKAREGALRFAVDWSRIFRNSFVQIEPALALRELSRVGVDPSETEAEYFGDWAMEADGEIVYAAKPKPLGFYAIHPKQFASDFAHTSWKVGFLKRMFRVPFPYGKAWMRVHAMYKKHH